MPIITIIDEQRAALEKVEALAKLGAAEPDTAADALAAILIVVSRANAVVHDILRAEH